MSINGYITNIQRCSTEDGPGIRTTVFLKGCPLRCSWCHNIETMDPHPQLVWHDTRCIGDQACIRACPENALELTADGMRIDRTLCKICGTCVNACPAMAMELIGEEWSAKDLAEELARDRVFFETSGGGVTISGGEALYQAEFAIAIARFLKEWGISVALDTCGYYAEDILRTILPFIDLVLYDLKIMDSDKHRQYTGVPVDRILSNALILAEVGIPTWIRTPIIPGHTDSPDNIRAISEFIVQHMPNVERYDLLAFNNMCIDKYSLFGKEYPLKDAPLVRQEYMEQLVQLAREIGVPNVHWSGMTQTEKIIEVPSQMEVGRCG